MSFPDHPPLYTMTFEEVERRAEAGEVLVSRRGHLLCSRDRKFNKYQAQYIWSTEVDNALYLGLLDPKDSPKKGVDAVPYKDNRPTNAKGRPFSWSHSALKNFEGCPARYAGEKFYCTVPYEESEAQIWGNRVHKAGELYVLGQDHNDPDALSEVQQYADLFRGRKARGVPVYAEYEIVLDKQLEPITARDAWFSKAAWFRAKLDVLLLPGKAAKYFDYKTGKTVKDDTDQLKTCLAGLSKVKPEIEEFSGKLIFTRHKEVTKGIQLDAEGICKVWEDLIPRVQRMEDAWKSETFPARKSGLCPYCPIKNCVYKK